MEQTKKLTLQNKSDLVNVVDDAINNISADIDEELSRQAVIKLYELSGVTPPPLIEFFDSPKQARDAALAAGCDSVEEAANSVLCFSWLSIWSHVFDFFIQLGFDTPTEELESFKLITRNIFAGLFFDEGAFVIRPPKSVYFRKVFDQNQSVSVDDNYVAIPRYELHKEGGEGAINYRDGSSQYFLEAIMLDKKVGSVPSDMWDPNIVFNESRNDLRALYMKYMGLARFLEKAHAEVLDTMPHTANHPVLGDVVQTFDLLKVPKDVTKLTEDIYALRMTCPSTGNTHIHGVDENCKTAREAYKYIWDCYPEEWLVEA